MNDRMNEVLKLLRDNAESEFTDNGIVWSQVYLDNAVPLGMNARQFAGYLSSLKKAGLYRSQGDDCFGDVKMVD